MHLLLERTHGVLAGRLGGVHRGVGVAQELVRLDRTVTESDPNRCRDAEVAAIDRDPIAHRGEYPVGDLRGLRDAVDAIEKHRKLVSTEPGRGVGRAHERIDEGRHPLQHAIPGPMPEAVVDRLEVIDVQEQHRQRPMRAKSCRQASRAPMQPASAHAGPVPAT